MTLNELNESYDEYVLTEEYYLEEGLKFFKKSKRLKKYANKINKKIAKKEGKKRISPAQLNTLKTLSKNLTDLSDKYAVIENDFASGNTDKKISKTKLKEVDRANKKILAKLKSKEVAGTFKAIGLGALVIGLGVVLFQIGLSPQMKSVLVKGFQNASEKAEAIKDAAAASLKTSASKISNFKDSIGAADAVEAPSASSIASGSSDVSGLANAEAGSKAKRLEAIKTSSKLRRLELATDGGELARREVKNAEIANLNYASMRRTKNLNDINDLRATARRAGVANLSYAAMRRAKKNK